MASKTRAKKPKAAPTAAQLEMAAIREIPSADRTQQQKARLDQLVQEDRRSRFVRLFPARMTKALSALDKVASCGNRTGYSYTTEQIDRAMDDLAAKLVEVKASFRDTETKKTKWEL